MKVRLETIVQVFGDGLRKVISELAEYAEIAVVGTLVANEANWLGKDLRSYLRALGCWTTDAAWCLITAAACEDEYNHLIARLPKIPFRSPAEDDDETEEAGQGHQVQEAEEALYASDIVERWQEHYDRSHPGEERTSGTDIEEQAQQVILRDVAELTEKLEKPAEQLAWDLGAVMWRIKMTPETLRKVEEFMDSETWRWITSVPDQVKAQGGKMPTGFKSGAEADAAVHNALVASTVKK
jgi:hypothetical protein